MAAALCHPPLFTMQMAVTFFFSCDSDPVCGRLDCLIRNCMSDTLVYNVTFPYYMYL